MIPQFVNPLLLWGLAAAAVPVVIHLLNRRRYRVQRWAAMEWLLAAARKNQKRLKMENLLLLLLRTCAVLFLALAIARPTFEGTALSLDREATHLFILLDNSASTGAKAGAGTALEGGLSASLSLLGDIGQEDPVTLVLTNDPFPDAVLNRTTGRARVVLRGTHDHAKVRQVIGEMKPAPARADLVDALQKLEEAVPARGPVVPRVAIVTDLQKVSFDGEAKGADTADAAIRSALERLQKKGAEVVLIPFGRPTANVAITSLTAQDNRDIVQGATVVFEAEVRNFGDRTVNAEVRFLLDGKERGDVVQHVPLAARAAGGAPPVAGAAQYSTRFNETEEGVHVLEARISSDALPVDDVRTFAFTVRKPIRVLAVDGDPRSDAAESETYGLKGALALTEGGPITVQVLNEPEYELERDLAKWDLVVLANVEHPASNFEMRRRLENYVRGGGALLLTAGDRVVADIWNRELGGANPLLPARLSQPRVDKSRSVDRKTAYQIDLAENKHPLLADITSSAASTFFTSPRIWGWITLEDVPLEKGSRVLTTYDDISTSTHFPKSPALVERSVGKGRVLLLTTTVDGAWGDLPRSYVYAPLLHETVYYLTSHGNSERNLLAFQGYTRTMPADHAGRIEVTAPDGQPGQATVETPPDAPAYAIVHDTSKLGAYRVTLPLKAADILAAAPPPLHDAFAVNVTPVESDLERLRPEDVESRWPNLLRVAGSFSESAQAMRPKGGAFHAPLLIASLLCLLGEVFLVRRIARTRAQAA